MTLMLFGLPGATYAFLVASQRLYMSVSPPVRWSVGHTFVFRPTRSDECRVYGPFTYYGRVPGLITLCVVKVSVLCRNEMTVRGRWMRALISLRRVVHPSGGPVHLSSGKKIEDYP